jgi:hypothetical protein
MVTHNLQRPQQLPAPGGMSTARSSFSTTSPQAGTSSTMIYFHLVLMIFYLRIYDLTIQTERDIRSQTKQEPSRLRSSYPHFTNPPREQARPADDRHITGFSPPPNPAYCLILHSKKKITLTVQIPVVLNIPDRKEKDQRFSLPPRPLS